mgnify:CR=1 FL=1
MLEADQTALLVVDFQERLVPKIHAVETVVANAVKLIQFARELQLPTFATEQYPKGLGNTINAIATALGDTPIIEKTSFGCFGEPRFLDAIDMSARTQLLVTGIETHVCVLQTVLAALSQAHEVYVVRDAVGSRRASDYEAALERMAASGASLVTVEMAIFEILRDADRPEFKRILPLVK